MLWIKRGEEDNILGKINEIFKQNKVILSICFHLGAAKNTFLGAFKVHLLFHSLSQKEKRKFCDYSQTQDQGEVVTRLFSVLLHNSTLRGVKGLEIQSIGA